MDQLPMKTGDPEAPELFVAQYREAMSRFPSGVTLVTTVDRQGKPWGFTASSFCAVSADPALVLVCLDKRAQCFPAFMGASGWGISVLRSTHAEVAALFATRDADKFAGAEFSVDDRGNPRLLDAVAYLCCDPVARQDAGDHVILLGAVASIEVEAHESDPAVYFRRQFRALAGVC